MPELTFFPEKKKRNQQIISFAGFAIGSVKVALFVVPTSQATNLDLHFIAAL